MPIKKNINVKGTAITVVSQNDFDYLSITDMTVGSKEGSSLIGKWITNKNTLEYLGIWGKLNNPNFNYPEFGVIEQEAGVNWFIMSVGQWAERRGTKTTRVDCQERIGKTELPYPYRCH